MPMRRRLLRPVWIALATLFLVEAWLWRHLAAALASAVRLVGLPGFKRKLAGWIECLPPLAALTVFLIPVALVLPLKVLGIWILARGSWLGAMAVLLLAKLVSMSITAFLFQVTRPKLLQIGWFRWLHGRVLVALAWAHRQIDPVRARMRAWAAETVAPALRGLRSLRAPVGRRWVRRILRVRRRVRRA
jgi:hypothetical protein